MYIQAQHADAGFARKALLALFFLLLAGCSGGEPSAAETTALKAQVEQESPPAFLPESADGKKMWGTIQKVYELRGFRPVWIANGRATARVDSLIRTLEGSIADGLSPEDLGLTDIVAKREAIKNSDGMEQLMDFETRLTYSLVRYGAYLSSRRGNPDTVDPKWRRTPRNEDLQQILYNAVEADTLEELPEKLAPPHPEYAALKEMLHKYREIEANGGWSPLPGGLTLKTGDSDSNVTVLRNNLALTGDLKTAAPGSTGFDTELTEAVLRFETRHGLKPDGILDPRLIEMMNVPVDHVIVQLEANLERLRWLPRDLGSHYIRVNIPDYELEVRDGNQVPLKMKVIVGANRNRTPLFSDTMESLVFSPYWNIPDSIATKEILPLIMEDPDYLLRQNIEVVRAGRTTEVIDPAQINWDDSPADFQYQLRQKPGAANSLGLVKFLFPNEYDVYLHDTPSDNLFDRLTRNFSHGCVRLERPTELAAYLLRDQPEWTLEKIEMAMHAGKETHVALKNPIPVHIVYWTAWVDSEGLLQIRPDVYGYDRPATTESTK